MSDLIIVKIIFLLIFIAVSLSLITWYFKDLPSFIRKPLVLIIFPISYFPRLILSLFNGDAYYKKFWKELVNNFKIAWRGYYG